MQFLNHISSLLHSLFVRELLWHKAVQFSPSQTQELGLQFFEDWDLPLLGTLGVRT